MNKEMSIDTEIRALLNSFWIVKDEEPTMYYAIKRKQGILKDFVFKNLGSRLIIHDRFIKLEKVAATSYSGGEQFQFLATSDYVYLCLVLLFLEDKTRKEIFVLSNLVEYVKNTAVTMGLSCIPDWNLMKDRRSLVRVIDFLERIFVIKLKDKEKANFGDDSSAEALYEATGLSNYVMRIFTHDIFHYETSSDFLKEEWLDQEEEKGDIRRYKVYRNLFYLPVSYRKDLSFHEFDYIKKLRGHMREEFASLGYELEVTRNMAFLYEYESNPGKEHFPNNKKITDIVLMVHQKLYAMIVNRELLLDEYEIGYLSRESLEVILKDVQLHQKEYLSKYFQNLPFSKFFLEVVSYMKEYFFLRETEQGFEVLPSISRFQAQLMESSEKQMDLFGGVEDV